ncbi:MAG: ZIP family metal transporter [Candidatus Vogelbacteria bacterium]|nr:ZIP family metal transporter [Candidatus Vogelbacteria bacterium]
MPLIVYVLGSVVLVSLASLLGIIGLSVKKELLERTLAFIIPLAVGALLGDALFHLIPEALEEFPDPNVISFLVIAGIFSFFLLERILRWHHHTHSDNPSLDTTHESESREHLGRLILVSDSLHNIIDGVIIGASYLVSIQAGIATTLAIILHEIPQEVGDFGVLIYSGYTRSKALLYNFISAFSAVVGALAVLFLGSFPEFVMQGILAFAAGIFIYIAASDLIPEVHKSRHFKNIFPEIIGMSAGVLAMYLLTFLE